MSAHSAENELHEAEPEVEGIPDSGSSATANGNRATNDDPLAALLESNRLLQQILLNRNTPRRQKIYVPMPEKFDGKVGDFIEAWLEEFET